MLFLCINLEKRLFSLSLICCIGGKYPENVFIFIIRKVTKPLILVNNSSYKRRKNQGTIQKKSP
jgi:hypothetical protein